MFEELELDRRDSRNVLEYKKRVFAEFPHAPTINRGSWIISDTHFGHESIIKFCNRPENHDFLMAMHWFDSVKPEDTILHLGDITHRGDRETMQDVLASLTGRKLWIKGNHDKQRMSYYEGAGFEHIGDKLGTFIEAGETRDGLRYENNIDFYGMYADVDGKTILFSHYPDVWFLNWDVNIHGHIHNNPYYSRTSEVMEVNPGKRWINVSVEVIDYRPVRLGDLLDAAKS